MADTAPLDDDLVLATLRRSMPNPRRPRLRTETEAALADVDQRSAEAYAAVELATESLRRDLDKASSSDAIPIPQEDWDECDTLPLSIPDADADK